MPLAALLWDVDGTLAETERDGHRPAFNLAFADRGLALHWDPAGYGRRLAITGGRERIRAALRELEQAEPDAARLDDLQACKQRHYTALVAAGGLRLRPGVAALIAAAAAADLRQAIVTTSGREAVEALAQRLLGSLAGAFEFWVCGGDVARKKPDPEAYALALRRLGLEAGAAVAIEDSPAGLAAATAAGLPCLVSLSHYGRLEPLERFAAARAVVSGLEPGARALRGPACPAAGITLSYLQHLL